MAAVGRPAKGKLAFREKRELELLPRKIEELDAKLAELHEAVGQPDFYKQPAAEIAKQQGCAQGAAARTRHGVRAVGRARTGRRVVPRKICVICGLVPGDSQQQTGDLRPAAN